MKYFNRIIVYTLFIAGMYACKDRSEGPYYATGIKIGEVTDTSALIWVRLTTDSIPSGFENPMPSVKYIHISKGDTVDHFDGERENYIPCILYPKGYSIGNIQGATKGLAGEIMIYYRPLNSRHWEKTEWISVDTLKDFTVQTNLNHLNSNTKYELRIVSRYMNNKAIGETLTGSFKTAPDRSKSQNILFTVSTGQAYNHMDIPGYGFKIYDSMSKLNPDFFIHTGDILYYDELAKNMELARWHWSRTYSLLTNLNFHKNTSSYFIKDDHDTWMDDCWPQMDSHFMGEFTFDQGKALFLEQVPMGEKTYRTYRWGKDLQFWLMEGRDFRSPNNLPDGPDKTIWGKEQKSWFYETVKNSKASFKILVSPTPLVGPDRKNKQDNHSNEGFNYEGDEIRSFIASIPNMYVICGDRHWQYVSVDNQTDVREYSCGPASNAHAGGWSNDNIHPEHRYFAVTGGFLATSILTENSSGPALIMTHYNVDGVALNSDTLEYTF